MLQMKKPTHLYVGKCKKCDGVMGSVYDMDDALSSTAKSVASMIRDNLAVYRVPFDGGVIVDGCHCRKDKSIALPLFEQDKVTP